MYVKYSFIAITSRSTLIQNGGTIGQIDRFEN